MNKCTTILLTLSLLICGDVFAMNKKGGKGNKVDQLAQASTWPKPSQAESAKAAADAKKAAECRINFKATMDSLKTLNAAHAETRVLVHPQEFRTHVVPSISPAARASLKPLPTQATTAPAIVGQQEAASTEHEMASVITDAATDPVADQAEAQVATCDAAPTDEMPVCSNEQLEALKAKIAAFNEKRDAAQALTSNAAPAVEAPAAVVTTEAPTVTTEVVPAATTVDAAPAAPATQVAATPASSSNKSSYITAWMKTKCLRSTNLAKALYFLQNTANRDDLTRKEIGSRLGDAIPETINALKQIQSLCYGKSEIQSADEITRLQEPLVNDLEAALKLAILPEAGEKQIQVDTSMLKLAVDELQKLNRHQKNQATRVVQAATAHAFKNKALAFLVKANMESRGDHELDGELSDDEYNGTLDMLNIVAAKTQEEAPATE